MSLAKEKASSLGRLSSFGVTDLWQIALLLPDRWDDFTRPVRDFSLREATAGAKIVAVGQLAGETKVSFDKKVPRMTGCLADGRGQLIHFSSFGDSRALEHELRTCRGGIALAGTVDHFNGNLWLKNPEVVPFGWLNRLRPVYPGKARVIKPETVRDRILPLLETAIPQASKFLEDALRSFGTPERLAELAGLPGWPLDVILLQSHMPQDLNYGRWAQRGLESLAAIGILLSARTHFTPSRVSAAHKIGDWRKRARRIPFQLTDEQIVAITEITADIKDPTPMRRVLSGDVGTGKTAVYGTAAASLIDAGGRVSILLPNATLATQIAEEFREWWPEIDLQLITSETRREDATAPLLIGTTALLHRGLGKQDLVVIDEQQKMARYQREQMVESGTDLLEVTATCIPRSQALIRYGVTKVSRLTRSHTPKDIRTRIWQRDEWKELMRGVQETISGGAQILLVYPVREKDDEGKVGGNGPSQLKSAEEIYEKWSKMFPGRVVWAHGQMDEAEKNGAVQAMREDRASILVSTSLFECGLNIGGLRRIVIVSPDRHGLTALHQLRGRVARQGGVGWCDLFLPYPVKGHTLQRLQVLEATQNGFEVSDADMRLRGIGDLSKDSEKQSGSDETFLYGRSVSVDVLDQVVERIEEAGACQKI